MNNNKTPLDDQQVAAIRLEYPMLPDEYFRYLRDEGWGEAESGRMIYEAPTAPQEIYGSRFQDSRIVLLGDDMQGYCFGFDVATQLFGEISDSGDWEPWPDSSHFVDYVTIRDE